MLIARSRVLCTSRAVRCATATAWTATLKKINKKASATRPIIPPSQFVANTNNLRLDSSAVKRSQVHWLGHS